MTSFSNQHKVVYTMTANGKTLNKHFARVLFNWKMRVECERDLPELEVHHMGGFLRVVSMTSLSKRALVFIEVETGSVFSPLSWDCPSQNLTGNIFTDNLGV